jgi:hypothetical protein
MLENKLATVEKELHHAKKDNAALAHYINARRKKEEDQRKEKVRKNAEEEARKKAEDSQSSKNIRTWRK